MQCFYIIAFYFVCARILLYKNLKRCAMKKEENKKKRFLKRFVAVVIVFALLFSACAFYVNDYHRADLGAISAFSDNHKIDREVLQNKTIVFKPKNVKAGFIFYPGGKVEYTAYIPLMEELAKKDIMCVLLKMPFNLAVLDVDGAEGIKEMFPETKNWYLGGHSLGGSMAASYLSDNISEYEGLVLLGSYSTADLSKENIKVLSVFGSEDKVMNKEKYDEYKVNLPEDFSEAIIDGGCHAYFGMYGAQDGDGAPTITNEEQIQKTAEIINIFIKK